MPGEPRVYVVNEPEIDTDLSQAVNEAVLLSAAHLDLFQRGPSYEKLRAIVSNISAYHLQKIARVARRTGEEPTDGRD